jgi:death-on-curing protein
LTEYLTLDSLLQVAVAAVDGEVQVRDYGLLESALARPRTTVFGAEAYPTLVEKASALLESLVRNHGLIDGNKRLGWLATEVFLYLNGHEVGAPDDTKFDLVMAVAEGAFTDLEKIAERLAEMIRKRG